MDLAVVGMILFLAMVFIVLVVFNQPLVTSPNELAVTKFCDNMGNCPNGYIRSCICTGCLAGDGSTVTATCAAPGNSPCGVNCQTTQCTCTPVDAPPSDVCMVDWKCMNGQTRQCTCRNCVDPATGNRIDHDCAPIGAVACESSCTVDCKCSGTSNCKTDLDCPDDKVCINNMCVNPPPHVPPVPGPFPPPIPPSGCTTDFDCPANNICRKGTCFPGSSTPQTCQFDSQCDQGEKCVNGICQSLPCFAHDQCDQGYLCINRQCQLPQCKGDTDCYAGQICAGGKCVHQFCNNSACPSGYHCDNNLVLCLPDRCTKDDQCPEGMHCDETSNVCMPTVYDPLCQGSSSCGCTRTTKLDMGMRCIKNLAVQWGCNSNSDCNAKYPGENRTCVEGSCILNASMEKNQMCSMGNCTIPSSVSNQSAHVLVVNNKSTENIWVGVHSNSAVRAQIINNNTGNDLPLIKPGQRLFISCPLNWNGRVWGRTQCSTSNGTFNCLTGDCANTLDCSNIIPAGTGEVTLFEMNFDDTNNKDTYDVSLVDGMNLGMTVTPIASTISKQVIDPNSVACFQNEQVFSANATGKLLSRCPTNLQKISEGEVIVCYTPRSVPGNSQELVDLYGCAGPAYQANTNCIPSLWEHNYASLFNLASDNGIAYSWPYSDVESTIVCGSAATGNYSSYCITFCDAK